MRVMGERLLADPRFGGDLDNRAGSIRLFDPALERVDQDLGL